MNILSKKPPAPDKIVVANDSQVFLPQDSGGDIPSHVLHCVNESRLTTATYSQPVTQYLVGWKDPSLESDLDYLAPAVEAPRRFEVKRGKNVQFFLVESDDVREIGGSFKRVELTGDTVIEKTLNKGLSMRIDHDEVVGDGWRERYAAYLKRRLIRNEIIRGVTGILGMTTNEDKTWSGSVNPDGHIREMLTKGSDEAGLRPNRILFGESAWDRRLDFYETTDTPYAGRAANFSFGDLAQRLLVDEVRVLRGRYQFTADEKKQFLSNRVVAYFAEEGLTKEEPTNIKRFYTPCRNGQKFAVYIEEHAKYTDISVEHYSCFFIPTTLGARSITIS